MPSRSLSSILLAGALGLLAVGSVGCADPSEDDATASGASGIEVVAGEEGRVTLTVVVKRNAAFESALVTATCGGSQRTILWGITDHADGAVRFTRLKPRDCTLEIYSNASRYAVAERRSGLGDPPTADGTLLDSLSLPVAAEGMTLQQSALMPEGYEVEATFSNGS